jgi:hypothetical protein
MQPEHSWYYQKTGERFLNNLAKRNMDGKYFPKGAELIPFLNQQIPGGAKVGFGGSRTLEELGIINFLRAGGFQLNDRARPGITPEEKGEIERDNIRADFFISGVNALTEDGRIVNIDGYGNRVAPMLFGPKRVFLVAGVNKICPTLEQALARAQKIAAPLNAYRLNRNTPCAQTGECSDCRVETRICSYTTIIDYSPIKGRITLLLVGAELGL